MVIFPLSSTNAIASHLIPSAVSDSTPRDRIFELYTTIRERDVLTSEHSRRVAIYAQRLARWLGYSRAEAQQYALLGRIHDIGKVWITDAILNKQTPLTPGEYSMIRNHAANGAGIVHGYDLSDFFVTGVQSHHEEYDGTGYPDRLVGTDIPEPARLIAIVDAFDVITSDRPYKQAASVNDAITEITAQSGIHFDPEFVSAFVTMLRHYPHFLVEARICVVPHHAAWHEIATNF